MEKTRKGIKPVRLPKALFGYWREIMDSFTKKNKSCQLIPTVTALQKLVASEDAVYDRQAACIKEAVKAIQKNVESIDNLQPTELNQIIQLVEPIASLGYFAASENLSRRTFVPLIEAAAKCIKNNKDLAFTKYYRQYICNDNSKLNFEGTLSQKALTICATLGFPIGHALITENYQYTLKYILSGLQSAQQQLKEAESISCTDSDQPMSDVQYSIKAILVLLSRQLTIATQIFEKVEKDEKDEDVALLGELCKILLSICADTTTFVKECNQIAGMAIGMFINLANNAEFARDWVLGWFFTAEKNSSVDQIESVLGVGRPSDKLVGEEGWNGRDAPMVFALRGLVSSLRQDVVLMDCPTNFNLTPNIEKSLSKNLHEIIFASIDLFCKRAELNPSCKVIAFESMATWLQQTNDIMQKCTDKQSMDSISGPIQPKNMNTLAQYVLDHWEDPIDSIQHKVRSIFELSISTLRIKTTFYCQQEEYNQFVFALLKNLFSLDWHRKVKYSLLNMLVEEIDTSMFLKAEPHLMEKCLLSMDSPALCSQIAFFILQFLYHRIQDTIPGYKDFKGHNGKIKDSEDASVKKATKEWVELWAVPILQCLTAPSELLRKNVSGFLLHSLFKIGYQSFWYMIRILRNVDHPLWENSQLDISRRLNAFIAVLKAGRSFDIVDGNAYTTSRQDIPQDKISVETLKQAIYHSDSQVRMDVLGLLCESHKATTEVMPIELEMLKLFIPLNMNSTSPEFRQQMCAHLSKVLHRLRRNLYSQYRNYKSLLLYAEAKEDIKTKQDAFEDAQNILVVIDQAKSFMFWLCDYVAQSLYPDASYQRVATALRILSIIIKLFGVTELPPIEGFANQQLDFPFKIPIASPLFSKLLIDVLLNPYDFNRTQAFDILCQFPSPLPGIESKSDAQDLLWWGLNNVTSTRASESDSGAMVFRLIFTKYVTHLGFDLSPEQNYTAKEPTSISITNDAAIVFTEKLLDLLEKQINIAKSNLLLAAQHHPMHGTLLALQYVVREIDYNSPLIKNNLATWKKIHAHAIELIHVACETAMPVLSDQAPEGNVPIDYREEDEEDEDEEDLLDIQYGPKHQVILSCCWRAVKEASSLLQVIITKASASPKQTDATIITNDDLVKSGALFRYLLTNIRHRGAFSAVYPAYVSLNSRLLSSHDPAISQLPGQWLQENLDSLTSSNISITRRSAGLPLCILAIVSSEPSVKKELLSKTMKFLMELASIQPLPDANQNLDLPQVHAYNIMRTIFMDSKLGNHILEYASDGFSLAISGFSSFSWAIRNCSVMLFSTLLQRAFGTKKTRDEHSSVNTLTGREFFIRFPQLHPYLLKELAVAVDQLLKNSLAASVHPGLFPILTLLSRMKPSIKVVNEEETVLSPFIPLVITCASSAIYKTREMAARAIVPLVQDTVLTIKQLFHINNMTSQNEIHGRLLQTQFLLRGHSYTNSMTRASYIQFINETPNTMVAMLELLCEKRFCNMNGALLLSIISEFFFDTKWMIAEDNDKELTKELIELCDKQFVDIRHLTYSYCMMNIQNKQVVGADSYLLREKMANIIILNILNAPAPKINEILFLLTDYDYEIRLLALQKLYDYFTNNTKLPFEGDSGNNQLQSILVQRTYEGEDNLNCYVLTAKLLMALSSKNPYSTDSKLSFSLEQYWNRLVTQFTERRALSATESILPLLGALLAQIIHHPSSLGKEWAQQCFITWSGYITQYSKTDITLPLREAVVKSLQFAFAQVFTVDFANDPFGKEVEDARVTAGLAVIQLLQDDDVDVRDETAAIVSKALHLQAPVHHERALELVHKHLTVCFKNSALLENLLAKSLIEEEQLETICKTELSQTKALFAKENPNIFKEDLIDVQWANVDLVTIYQSHPPKEICMVKVAENMKQLLMFSKLLSSMSRTFMQHGPFGVTSRPNIFMAVYSSILSLHIAIDALEIIKPTKEFMKSVQDLSSALLKLKQEWVHPLIWNLLRDDLGLYSKLRFYMKRHDGIIEFDEMFLLAPDSKYV